MIYCKSGSVDLFPKFSDFIMADTEALYLLDTFIQYLPMTLCDWPILTVIHMERNTPALCESAAYLTECGLTIISSDCAPWTTRSFLFITSTTSTDTTQKLVSTLPTITDLTLTVTSATSKPATNRQQTMAIILGSMCSILIFISGGVTAYCMYKNLQRNRTPPIAYELENPVYRGTTESITPV